MIPCGRLWGHLDRSAVAQKIHYQGGRCLKKWKKKLDDVVRGLGERLHSLNRFKRSRAAPVTPPGKVSLRATVMVKWEDAHEAVVWAEVNSGKHNKLNGKENLAAAAAAAASALQSLRPGTTANQCIQFVTRERVREKVNTHARSTVSHYCGCTQPLHAGRTSRQAS